MAKIYSVFAGGLLSLLALGAQPAVAQVQQVPPHRTCATEDVNDQIQAELKRLIPGYNSARSTNQGLPYHLRPGATNVTYTLPVIVHVIHNGEAVGRGSNIHPLQVQSQLTVLNEDYRNLNADGTLVPGVYQALRGDMEIQFVAAKFDPNGNLLDEPGIDRVNRTTKGWTAPPYTTAYINSTIKPNTSWDPSRYINIWTADISGGILGYAQFPNNTAGLGGLNASGGAANTDGVVVGYSAYGSRLKFPGGTYGAPYDKGRTLTHELGHWFSLRHIWGDAACGTDYCADTPTQQAENYSCPTHPKVTCSNVTGDMFMNYMDYVDDACMQMFSLAQKDRMQAIMAAGTPRRSELATSTVGCTSVVAATATNSGAACPGSTITLTATGPAGATYTWTGPNGFTSTQQNPTLTNVTSAMAGNYNVKVSVTTGACANFALTTVTINPAPPVPSLAPSASIVCPGSSATLTASGVTASPLPSENFNGAATGWTLANSGATTTGWQYRTAPFTYSPLSNYSIDGTNFVLANSDIGGSGSITNTTLTSPVFSTNGYSTLQVMFQHYLRYISGDVATVEVTTDGGTTWTAAVAYGATQGSVTTPATATVNLNAFLNKPAVQVRWRYTTSWAWYWALDNVNFSGTVATPAYTWSLVSGDGLPTATNATTLAVTPTQNSVYRLTVAYPGLTCTSTATVNVNAYPTPVLVSSVPTACPGSPATLSATNAASIASFSPTYAWSLVSGDGLPTAINAATLAVTPTQNSVYRLTVTYPGGCALSSTVSVAVVPTPVLATSASVICAGTTSQLSATNIPTTGYTYAWTQVSGNGLPAVVNTPTITVSPTQVSVYRLTVSSGSCSTSSTVTVTGITNQIDAYPVPFGDAGLSLQVSTCTAGPATVQIYDIMGRRMYESTVGAPQVGITTISLPETSRLRPGKYIVKVQQGTQNTTFNVVRQ
jgi:hypothetical protein